MKAENTKANTEYESLKAEVVKAVQGKRKMPVDVLSELVNESRDKVLATSERLTTLMAELERRGSNPTISIKLNHKANNALWFFYALIQMRLGT